MKKLFLTLSMVLAISLVACGGSEEVAEKPVAPELQTVAFELSDAFAFEPATINAKAGQSVRININNKNASVNHSWVLVEKGAVDGASTPEEIAAAAINRANSGEIEAGVETSFSFTAPEAGTYEYVCSVAGHLSGGMKGDFIVE